MGRGRSWKGDHGLKAQVLEQVKAHHRRAKPEPIEVAGQRLELYGWSTPRDPTVLGEALGIPPALLSIGLYLSEGFPEDPLGMRQDIDAVKTFLSAIPVGQDVERVAPRFLAHWASEPGWGMMGQTDGRFDTLFEELALGLLGEPFDAARLERAKRDVERAMERAWAEHQQRRRGIPGPDGRASFVHKSGRAGEWRVMELLEAGMAMVRWEHEPGGLRRALDRGLAADAEEAARRELLAELGRATLG